MKEQDLLCALEEIVANLNITLRYEKGDFEGGLCRVGQDRLLIVNSLSTRKKRISLLAHELAKFTLDDIFIMPAVRKVIDNERGGQYVAELQEETHE